MSRGHFLFHMTLDEFTRRLRRYVEVFPPREFRDLQFERDDLGIIWDSPTRNICFTLYGVSPSEVKARLLDCYAIEDDGSCAVSIDCDEPGDPHWLEQLLNRLSLARSESRLVGWPDWLAPSSCDLTAPFAVNVTDSTVPRPATQVQEKPTEARAPKSPKVQRNAVIPQEEAPRPGRKPGKRNTPREKRDAYCRHYWALDHKVRLKSFCWVNNLQPSTFCHWLNDLEKRIQSGNAPPH